MSPKIVSWLLKTGNGTMIEGESITECVEKWNRLKPLFQNYADAMIESIEPSLYADVRNDPLELASEDELEASR